MKKNFYLMESYFLGYTAIVIFFKYFLLTHLSFYDILYKFYINIYEFMAGEVILIAIISIFLILKRKYSEILEKDNIKKYVYFLIFAYVFFKNYAILRLR